MSSRRRFCPKSVGLSCPGSVAIFPGLFLGWWSCCVGSNLLGSGSSWQGNLPLCVPSSLRLARKLCIRIRFQTLLHCSDPSSNCEFPS